MYTPEMVRAIARSMRTDDATHYAADAAHMLEDYAATLKAAQGGVTEATYAAIGKAFREVLADPSVAWRDTGAKEFIDRVCASTAGLEAALSAEPAAQGEDVVDRVAKAIADAAGHGMREKCEHMAHAAIAALSAPEPAAQGEAVATVHRMGNCVGQLVYCEFGLNSDLPHGTKLYTAPPAQPAERVPEVNWLADQLCDLRNQWAEGCEANWLETDDNHPDDWMAKELRKRWLAATPAPSEGGKGVEG